MKLLIFLLFLFWLYHYWRFTGKRKYYKKMVIVAEHRHDRLQSEQSALELASAYMQVQRYADAYNTFASVLLGLCMTVDYKLYTSAIASGKYYKKLERQKRQEQRDLEHIKRNAHYLD